MSCRVQILGWLSADMARASRSKRSLNSREETLMATGRPRRVSVPRYTSPMPPLPIRDAISYGPSLSPGESRISSIQCTAATRRVKGGSLEPGGWNGKPRVLAGGFGGGIAAALFAVALARQGGFHALFFAGLKVEGVALDLLDDFLAEHQTLEPAQRALQGFAVLQMNFSH